MTIEDIKQAIKPKVCYMGNIKTLDTFDGLMAAEKYIQDNKLTISTSFSNVTKEAPQGQILDCGYVDPTTEEDILAIKGAIGMIDKQDNIYSFVENPCKLEDLYFYTGARVLFKVATGMKLNKHDEKFIADNSDLIEHGILKRGGWIFNFKPYWKEYWVMVRDGDIISRTAPSQQLLISYLEEQGYSIKKIMIAEDANVKKDRK